LASSEKLWLNRESGRDAAGREAMNGFLRRFSFFAAAGLAAASAFARPQQSASAESDLASPPAASVARIVPGRVFAFSVSTKSPEAKQLVESALDQYENALLDSSVESARRATEKDPHFALAYAVWSFAARRTQPNVAALGKAELLAAQAPADERLLVKFLTSVQHGDMLPAISSMNDLLARFPGDGHALYLTAEWLYFQQDYQRAVRIWEQLIKVDPNFAPAYNMLGYAMVESGEPDPQKALAYLNRYAELLPRQANPQDSLGEVSRYAGDDAASLVHYREALKITPTFVTSQIGLGDTYTLMGDFSRARAEYDKASAICTLDRDCLHIQFQKALVRFWEGNPGDGRSALGEVERKARSAKEPYSRFEAGEALAALAADPDEGLQKLRQLEETFGSPMEGMNEADRNTTLAAIWLDQARAEAERKNVAMAERAVGKLERLSEKSRDLVVQDRYESARGYVLFARQDYRGAAEQLSADPHSPVALKWLVTARQKSGDGRGSETARLRLKFLRAPTVEWYLASRSGGGSSD
jgi:tetratricopeptide (TPR) repeat protein